MPAHLPSIALREAEHIVDIFLHFLPRKYALDGAGKTNLVLGPIPSDPRYLRLEDVNQFVLSEFDRDRYYASGAAEQDEMVLAALETCLLEIALEHGADARAIRQAASKTRECGFALKRESKLSRSTSSRRVRLHVFQHLSRGGNKWTLEVRTRGGEHLDTVVIGDSNAWDAAHDYRKSKWVGDEFVITDFLGRISFRYNAAQAG